MKKIYLVIIAVAVIALGVIGFNTVKGNASVPKTAEKAFEMAEEIDANVLNFSYCDKSLRLVNASNCLLASASNSQVLLLTGNSIFFNPAALLATDNTNSQWVNVSREDFSFTDENYKNEYKALLKLLSEATNELEFTSEEKGSFKADLDTASAKAFTQRLTSVLEANKAFYEEKYNAILSNTDTELEALIKAELSFNELFEQLKEEINDDDIKSILVSVVYTTTDAKTDSFEVEINFVTDGETKTFNMDCSINSGLSLDAPAQSNLTAKDAVAALKKVFG